ncbi:ThiF family adenylyltransferase [Candidatus Woesearchaeota archaeon]|nr:ThiF family adenylyltransferase [Candidatus Woesearchaeota archaeon]
MIKGLMDWLLGKNTAATEVVDENDPAGTTEVVDAQVNELVRYDRQLKIWGTEGQQKLEKGIVSIVGAGSCAQFTALPLVALGIGQVRMLGCQETTGFLDIPHKGEAVFACQKTLHAINPNVTVAALPVDLESRLALNALRDSQIIIETTNNPKSKLLVMEYAKDKKIPVMTTGVGGGYTKLSLWQPDKDIEAKHLMPQFHGEVQNPLLSLLWGGIIAEEVKKMLLGDAAILTKDLYYKLGHSERFSFLRHDEAHIPYEGYDYSSKAALVIGAGALGNIMAIALSMLGFGKVDYLDYDTVESHNLNRQVLFYDAVGQPKADVLARKHVAMNPRTSTRAFVAKLEKVHGKYSIDSMTGTHYDVGFDLVDNLYARALFSAYAMTHGMNLISAASSPTAAQVAVSAPGRTACLNHIFNDYYERGRAEEIIRRQSCIAQPDPSVIITNQVAAALAALEVIPLFDPRDGHPFNGSLKYGTALESRLGENPIRDICDCHARKDAVPDMEIK